MTVKGSLHTGPGQRRGLYGPGSLVKNGSYKLTVNPAGSFPGGTTINQGTIQLGNAAALGTGAVQINAGGTLNAANVIPANAITLNGGTLWTTNRIAGQITLNKHYRALIAKNPLHHAGRLTWVTLYIFVAIQSAWVLRPFVGSPGLPSQFFREDPWSNAYVVVARDVWAAAKSAFGD